MEAKQFSLAVELAQNLRNRPTMALDPEAGKLAIGALYDAVSSSTCFMKAQLKGLKTFCLISSDPLAPAVIDAWADRAEAAGVDAAKVAEARAMADEWRVLHAQTHRLPD